MGATGVAGRDEVEAFVRESFVRHLGVELPAEDANFFTDLAVSSLGFLNVVSHVEKRFRVRFANELVPELVSLERLVGAVLAHQRPPG